MMKIGKVAQAMLASSFCFVAFPAPAHADRHAHPAGPPSAHHGHGNPHGYAPGHAWHGEISRFHEHDFDRWRGGHWYNGHHGGRLGWWWIVGPAWYFYPYPVYPYPDPFLPPTIVLSAPPQYWYYCANPPGYYPYVPQCLTEWQRVPATGVPAFSAPPTPSEPSIPVAPLSPP